MRAPATAAIRRLLAACLVACGLLAACGRDPGSGDTAAAGGTPAGFWTLDREALIETVRKRHGREGGEDLAREEAQARLLEVDLEIRADGRYGMRTKALDLAAEACVGVWRLEGKALQFRRQVVDGKPVTSEKVEEARFADDRILLPFPAVGFPFPLKRR